MHQFSKFTPAWNSICFRQFPLPIIRSLFTVHSAFEQDQGGIQFHPGPARKGPGWNWSCSKAVFISVWHIPVPSVQWINSWWWTEELPETCRVSCPSEFGKLLHLVGFIIKKYVVVYLTLLKPSGYLLDYLPPGLTFTKFYVLLTQSTSTCRYVSLTKKNSDYFQNSINLPLFKTEKQRVYCAVRNETSGVFQVNVDSNFGFPL